MTESVISELDRLRGLARALVHGDEAEDLIQDAAVAALEHPPQMDRPVRAWLSAVIRNRWFSTRRAAIRREAREQAVAPESTIDGTAVVERARLLERLASAVVALDEPYRGVVIRRYLDGKSSAAIARELEIPAGTVRWRLKVGLDRLRDAMDEAKPRKQWALLLAAKGAPIVKTKIAVVAVILALIAAVAIIRFTHVGVSVGVSVSDKEKPRPLPLPPTPTPTSTSRSGDLTPVQGRVAVAETSAAGGSVSGRVINWSTGDGVEGAEIVFGGAAGAVTVHAQAGGVFELAPAVAGRFVLVAASAPGFLPYAPEYMHSEIVVSTERDRAVRGLTVFLFPALDYHGLVVDAAGQPVAGARVRNLGTPSGDQILDKLATEFTADAKGEFVFHAADEAVFEAVHGAARGWAMLDGNAVITHHLTIKIAAVPPRDAQITGRVIDADGKPLADVVVNAMPVAFRKDDPRAPARVTTGPDGTFVLGGLTREMYSLMAEQDGFAPARTEVMAGSQGVELAMLGGESLAGIVTAPSGAALPAFTLLVFQRDGAKRDLLVARSIVELRGRFDVHVPKGDYDLVAAATGWAPATRTTAAPARDLKLAVSEGGTVRGKVVSVTDGSPIAYARVSGEAMSGGASAQPANAGTVTRADGAFELTGVAPGPLSVHVDAGGFDPKIAGPWTTHDGEVLGPFTIALTPLAEGQEPKIELVGIGVQLSADHDGLKIEHVIAGGGAAAAGIVDGEHIVAVEGTSVADLGLNGAIARIRGPEGTTITISLRRGEAIVPIAVERRKLRV